MKSNHLSILAITWMLLLYPTDAQMISSCSEKISLMNSRRKVVEEVHSHDKVVQSPVDETSIHLRSSRRGRPLQHRHSSLKTAHGISNIIGWGILLPTGVITARYLKKSTMKDNDEWYPVHVMSQISGFILGTVGWGLGMYIRSASRKKSMSLHGILGTVIFALSAIQITLGLRLAVNQVPVLRKKLWVICHHLVGYALVILIIANIFEGIENRSPAKKWNWSYGVILGAFCFVALGLELLRWTRFRDHIDAVTEDIFTL